MKSRLKKFVKERDEMLKKRSVAYLRKFVNDNADLYGVAFVERINGATDEVLEITLHKMIMQVPSLPSKLRYKSAIWLMSHGFDLSIN